MFKSEKSKKIILFIIGMITGVVLFILAVFLIDDEPASKEYTITIEPRIIEGNVKKSPFYLIEDTETLQVCEKFEAVDFVWCGPSTAKMILNYYGVDASREELEQKLNMDETGAVAFEDMGNAFPTEWERGRFTHSGSMYNCLAVFKEQMMFRMKENHPVIACSNGHAYVIFGYDDRGTEEYMDDLVLVADSGEVYDKDNDGYAECHSQHLVSDCYNYEDDTFELMFYYAYPKNSKIPE